ncbi:acyclic terpene utilization AtuA family protein [Hydrogenophaga sp.]|uniref:acyclic terpene utilization AtuA family protein n=1 Tax=Hydrogenophaga sp. TaxID=1904254 RepID=UPI00272013D0|nr:acyclic terpene utilization AtuA family protein [Hydrogenophaga sp.]MDO9437609.1 acyclic terpene utilization AtuA family protein [Hydrogenophaga sp.]
MTSSPHGRLLVGCAAGFSGDRTDAAGPVVDTLIAMGGPAFLIFETLAERTLALAQLRRRADADAGYEPLLEDMLRPVLARCMAHGIRIVSNFGAANPLAAARKIRELAAHLGLPAPRIAVVHGDDLSGAEQQRKLREHLGATLDNISVVSANAYQGAEAIAQALDAGAQIVVAGRVADPSLVVGPALSHFGWPDDEWDRIAGATMAGHLLECGAQVCGGYFADPGFKDVHDLHSIGYPIAEIFSDGSCIIGKAAGTGGEVSLRSMKEQLLYEIHDPSAYLTPDVTASIAEVVMEAVGEDRVRMSGVRGRPRPDMLKVNVCYEGGWLAEGEISYAGARAESRARLAADVLRKRLHGLTLRCDLIGVVSVFADDGGCMRDNTPPGDARDVRLRVAAAHADKQQALRVAREVTALYTCGPAGGGGVRTHLTQRLALLSGFVPREAVPCGFSLLEDVDG